MALDNKYNHTESEKKWQKYWQDKKVFAWKNDLPKSETFVIDTPPPTVSGVLHMGHVFSYTQADFIARYQRMNGKDVFYPMGFDDNGLPTERLVEKVRKIKVGNVSHETPSEKNDQNPSKSSAQIVSRETFIQNCQQVVDEAEKEFEALFNGIALSVDWDQKYQTISDKSQKLSQSSFVDLYKKGLVERKFEPVIWDIADQTALSQADLVDKEKPSTMNFIDFELGDGEKIEIMTTRPELLGACVAVMINSSHLDENDGKKWAKLLENANLDENGEGFTGKYATSPLFEVKLPIFADNDVKTDKGTGAVMCCTFGDETDIKWFKKHGLDLRLILDKAGRILPCEELAKDGFENLGDDFDGFYAKIAGLKFKKAREIIVEELQNGGFLNKVEEITHAVKCGERSGVPVEIIVEPQWFIKILDKKSELKKRANECNWFPEFMKLRVEQWIDNLSWDWCISRQRYFGVNFPIWYSKRKGEEGKIIVADFDELPIDPTAKAPKGYDLSEVEAETDIMDTWATSSISPQLSSGLVSKEMVAELLENGAITKDEADAAKSRHEKLFPADLRPQAHEIIRTWAFYTIVKAHLHEESIPWKNLMISGWCLAADKTKMSKSKGNVVTPTALIEEKGSDVVRYWTSTSHLGADTAYSDDVFKIGQKLLTKIYNATKFAAMNFEKLDEKDRDIAADSIALTSGDDAAITQAADLWILSRLHQTITSATASFEKFEYARAREAIEDFFWNDLCDNYLEICKVRSYGTDAQKWEGKSISDEDASNIKKGQKSAILTLKVVLNSVLKLFAPFIPHICEELYSEIFAEEFSKTKSINARGNWPKSDMIFFDEDAIKLGEAALEVIFKVRKFKSDNNLSMKVPVSCLKITSDMDLTQILDDLGNVCNAIKIETAIESTQGAVKVEIEA